MSCLKILTMCHFLLVLFLWLYAMTTTRASTSRVVGEIANVGSPSKDDKAPPHEQASLKVTK